MFAVISTADLHIRMEKLKRFELSRNRKQMLMNMMFEYWPLARGLKQINNTITKDIKGKMLQILR